MSDTQTVTAIPTPAQDAYKAAKAEQDAERGDYMAREFHRLGSETSKDEAIAAALKAEPWLQKSKVTTKDKALRIVVRKMWDNTDMAKALEVLAETASVERRLISRAGQSADRLAHTKEALLKVVGNPWDAERTIDYVASLRQEAVESGHWDEVLDYARENGVGPVEALKEIVKRVQKDMLYSRNHRVMSRSTSLSNNLVTDLDTEANVSWLDDANDLLRGF